MRLAWDKATAILPPEAVGCRELWSRFEFVVNGARAGVNLAAKRLLAELKRIDPPKRLEWHLVLVDMFIAEPERTLRCDPGYDLQKAEGRSSIAWVEPHADNDCASSLGIVPTPRPSSAPSGTSPGDSSEAIELPEHATEYATLVELAMLALDAVSDKLPTGPAHLASQVEGVRRACLEVSQAGRLALAVRPRPIPLVPLTMLTPSSWNETIGTSRTRGARIAANRT